LAIVARPGAIPARLACGRPAVWARDLRLVEDFSSNYYNKRNHIK